MTGVDTRALVQAVVDDVWDYFDVDDEVAAEWFMEHIEEPVRALVCELKGHDVVDDQCMKPEHRYCVICGVRQPDHPVEREGAR